MNRNNGGRLEEAAWARRIDYDFKVLDAFARVEQAEVTWDAAYRNMMGLIRDDPFREWPRQWRLFMNAGGATKDELSRWLIHRRQIRPVANMRRNLRVLAMGTDHRNPQWYRNDNYAERDCDRCGRPYCGPEICCSLECTVAGQRR
jgi:hypothetical protein